ncbi:MAG: DMT family transporter [Pseudobdellovibrionaceae bacterium]
MQRQILAVIELIFAGVLWGFGFIASVWCLQSFSPLSLTTTRFAIASAVGLLILLIPRVREGIGNRDFWTAAIPGFMLSATLILQTWGLKYTTATKSGFITTLYVMLVPVFEMFFMKRKLHFMHAPLVFLALVGTAMIVDLKWDGFNLGDLLTLICAFTAALHIFYLGIVSPKIKNSFAFNTFQSIWASLLALGCIPFFEGPHFKGMIPQAWIGLTSLAFGSTLIGFYLQVKAQRILSPSLSSLLFLLESPFAMIFAILILHEALVGFQFVGAVIIFASAICATVLESQKKTVSDQ